MGVAAMPAALLLLASPAKACGAGPLAEGRVAAIEDAGTLRLTDGRIIRLAGIEWTVSRASARKALGELVFHRTLALKGDTAPDRYGRIHAFPFVSGSETPIQYTLVARGLAVTGTRIRDAACRNDLLARERKARAAKLGSGADSELTEPDTERDTGLETGLETGLGIRGAADYRLHQADEPAAILNSVGRFAIVQGRVLSVRESGNTVYVNFGRRWSEDFTVTIAKRKQPAFMAAGLPPKSLAGRIVRVRGVIEERAGPWIEATGADQFDWDDQQ